MYRVTQLTNDFYAKLLDYTNTLAEHDFPKLPPIIQRALDLDPTMRDKILKDSRIQYVAELTEFWFEGKNKERFADLPQELRIPICEIRLIEPKGFQPCGSPQFSYGKDKTPTCACKIPQILAYEEISETKVDPFEQLLELLFEKPRRKTDSNEN
jgi:hypothetical protein